LFDFFEATFEFWYVYCNKKKAIKISRLRLFNEFFKSIPKDITYSIDNYQVGYGPWIVIEVHIFWYPLNVSYSFVTSTAYYFETYWLKGPIAIRFF
jgi:hypothetical protein